MPSEPPDDEVLFTLLASGGFEHCLRVECGGGGTAAAILFLIAKYPGLTHEGASWLADTLKLATDAGFRVSQLGQTERVDISTLPVVPSGGIAEAEHGDIVFISEQRPTRPDGTIGPGGIATVEVYPYAPTREEIERDTEEFRNRIRDLYDIGAISGDEARYTIRMTYGLYRVG